MVTLLVTMHAPAWAQDGWSFVVTPQVWLSHIAKNGFAANPDATAGSGGILILTSTGDFVKDAFQTDSSPKNDINPQWGLQVAAQKGRLTLAGAFQYVDFTTNNDIKYVHPEGGPLCAGIPVEGGISCFTEPLPSGGRYAVEVVDTTRFDVDVAASYFFPDVVKDRIDASLGVGLKYIYASASRTFARLSDTANFLQNFTEPPGLYTICPSDLCDPADFKQKVKSTSHVYGMTLPMNATVRLTNDWLLPISVSPFLGAETRDDKDVAYSFKLPQNVSQFTPPPVVDRLDGTTFAYGVTAEAGIRWILTEALSAYAGMRVQYIHGHETFLAYGPILAMSFRFGGK
jgi:hypothetical protein